MYDPIAISNYGRERHQEYVREAEAYWRAELAREARGDNISLKRPRPANRLQHITRLLTTLLR
ncbi:MAG TPA: hypothetical protein VKY59_12020 [Spirillospora sp.]|nr:hypothetical protein [Spirillospora sp.]